MGMEGDVYHPLTTPLLSEKKDIIGHFIKYSFHIHVWEKHFILIVYPLSVRWAFVEEAFVDKDQVRSRI